MQDLTSQVPAEIDFRFAVTLTNLSVRKATPTQVKKGAAGPIGKSRGIPDVTGTFRLAVPKTGLEFDLDALNAKEGGFTISYTLGAAKYAIIGCSFSEDDLTVDQGQGNVEVSVNFTGTERVRLS